MKGDSMSDNDKQIQLATLKKQLFHANQRLQKNTEEKQLIKKKLVEEQSKAAKLAYDLGKWRSLEAQRKKESDPTKKSLIKLDQGLLGSEKSLKQDLEECYSLLGKFQIYLDELDRQIQSDQREQARLTQLVKSLEKELETSGKLKKTIYTGNLNTGDSDTFDCILRGTVTYVFFVDADEPGVDFDLFIYNENGQLVTKDSSSATDAQCILTPEYTQHYTVKIKSSRGVSNYSISIWE